MNYKVNKGTETYRKIDTWFSDRQICRDKATELVKEITGKSQSYFPDDDIVSHGGISGVPFDEKPEKGWIEVSFDTGKGFYIPHGRLKIVKEVREKINNLPKVHLADLKKAMGLEKCFWSTPGVSKSKDCYLVSFNEELYKKYQENPAFDLIEITHSEYEKLKKGDEE